MSFLRRLSAVFGSLLLAASAWTAPQSYAQHQVQIRAGVVMLSDDLPGGSCAPHVLYNLDHATQVKPAGWSILNPHAPGIVTAAMVSRWTTILGAMNPDLPIINSPIAKNNAEYWAVYLGQVSDQVLSDYDFLVVNPASTARLTPAESAKLLKFVDQGGVLWIDPSNLTTFDVYNNFPLAFGLQTPLTGSYYANIFDPLLTTPKTISTTDLNYLEPSGIFQNGLISVGTTGSSVLDSFNQEIFSQFLEYRTVTQIGSGVTMTVARVGEGAIVVTPTGISQTLNRVHGSVFAGQPGGFTNTSYTAASYGTTSSLFPGYPVLENDALAAAKLAINMISLTSDMPGPGGASRHKGGSGIDVAAPLLSRWSAQGTDPVTGTSFLVGASGAFSPAANTAAPVLYKGVIVATTQGPGGAYITVLKAHPGTDLDGDGDPDDGIGAGSVTTAGGVTGSGVDNSQRDYSVGQTYDVIWVSKPMTGPISAPVCVSVPDAVVTGKRPYPSDQVLVVDANGALNAFDLFNKNASGLLIGGAHEPAYTIAPKALGIDQNFVFDGAQPSAPTVSGDLAYVSQMIDHQPSGADGVVWIADLSSGLALQDGDETMSSPPAYWFVGGGMSTGQPLPGYTGPPTVGSVTVQDNSGGYDKVLYAPGIVGSNNVPTFTSLWLGVKSESPTSALLSGSTVTINTRAAGQANLPIYMPSSTSGLSPAQLNLLPKLTLLDTNGNAIPYSQFSSLGITAPLVNAGGGVLTFDCNPAAYTAAVSGLRVDYTIDWGANPNDNTIAIERGRLAFPLANNGFITGQTPTERILGNIALTSAGTLVMTVSDPDPSHLGTNGSLWWIKEDQGRGNFRVTGRFSLFPSHEITVGGGAPVQYPAVFINNDPLLQIPQVSGHIFNTISNYRWSGAPVVVGGQVFALASANTYYDKNSLKAVPITLAMSFAAEPSTPVLHTSGLSPGFTLTQPDFDRSDYGSLSPPNVSSSLNQGSFNYDTNTGTVTISNLASVTRGQITDSLSLSQPIIVQGSTSTLLEPDEVGDTWTPLQWYCVYLGNLTTSAPLVCGSSLYMASASIVPTLLSTGQLTPSSGVVNAMYANIAPNDPSLVTNTTARPWQKEVPQVTQVAPIVPNPEILMPAGGSAQTLDEYITLLQQTVMGNSQACYGIAGGGGQDVVTWGDQGIYGLSKADFLVCDSGRFIRTDSAGNPLFSSNSNVSTGPGGGNYVGRTTPMVTPVRAYPLDQGDTLIVDAGANRVAKVDASGVEERSITKFFPDLNFKPNGYQGNEPLNFIAPHDAITYTSYESLTGLTLSPGNNEPAGATQEFWVHYLVADSGHERLVELVDRYTVNTNGQLGPLVTVTMPDPNAVNVNGSIPVISVPQTGVLLWQSPANVSGKHFDYNSVSRVYLPSLGYVFVAGIGSSQPTRANTGLLAPSASGGQGSTGSGGIIIFASSGIQVYDTYDQADTSAVHFFDPATNMYDIAGHAGLSGQPLAGVTAVTAKAVMVGTTPEVQIMVSMATGVYEFTVNPQVGGEDLGTPDWFINSAAFTAMRRFTTSGSSLVSNNPAQFHPFYARRLDSGDVLLVNAYVGTTAAYNTAATPVVPTLGSSYGGEVIMLDGTTAFSLSKKNLGFFTDPTTGAAPYIHFVLPTIVGTRNLVAPVFADRR